MICWLPFFERLRCWYLDFAENSAAKFGVSSGRDKSISRSLKLKELDEIQPVGDWPFRELVGCLMWLAKQTRPDIVNAVRAVARYANKPREVHCSTAIGILGYVFPRAISALPSRRAVGLSW